MRAIRSYGSARECRVIGIPTATMRKLSWFDKDGDPPFFKGADGLCCLRGLCPPATVARMSRKRPAACVSPMASSGILAASVSSRHACARLADSLPCSSDRMSTGRTCTKSATVAMAHGRRPSVALFLAAETSSSALVEGGDGLSVQSAAPFRTCSWLGRPSRCLPWSHLPAVP